MLFNMDDTNQDGYFSYAELKRSAMAVTGPDDESSQETGESSQETGESSHTTDESSQKPDKESLESDEASQTSDQKKEEL